MRPFGPAREIPSTDAAMMPGSPNGTLLRQTQKRCRPWPPQTDDPRRIRQITSAVQQGTGSDDDVAGGEVIDDAANEEHLALERRRDQNPAKIERHPKKFGRQKIAEVRRRRSTRTSALGLAALSCGSEAGAAGRKSRQSVRQQTTFSV